MNQPDPARLPVLNQVIDAAAPLVVAPVEAPPEAHAGPSLAAAPVAQLPAALHEAPWGEALRAALDRRLDAELHWRVRALLAPRLDALADELAEALQPALRDIARAALEEIRDTLGRE